MSRQLNLVPENYQAILESLPTAVYVVDPDRRIVFWNDGCEKMTGYLRHEVIGRNCAEDFLMHCDSSGHILCGAGCPLLGTMHKGRPGEAELFLRHKKGYRVPVRVRAVPIRNCHEAVIGACECFDERIVIPSRESHTPGADLITCQSQAALLLRLEADLQCFRETQISFGVLRFRIDGLDQIRAQGGNNALEAAIECTVQTLVKCAGPGNLVAMWNGDRFLVILYGCSERSLLESATTLLALASLEAVPWWGTRLALSLSAGGTMARPGETPTDLVQRAAAALRNVEGKNRLAIV